MHSVNAASALAMGGSVSREKTRACWAADYRKRCARVRIVAASFESIERMAYNPAMNVVYLDNNATTRPAPEVIAAMMPFFEEYYGNPSSVHRFGQRARQALDEARGQLAQLIGASEAELSFTGGGTEAVNTAIRGILATRTPRRKVVISSVEHSATRELCQQLGREGCEIVTIDVDQGGSL